MASKQNGGSGRGFASMDPQKQREIASKGGASVPDAKRPFSQNRALASEAGRKGGEARSRAHAANAAKRALQPKENPQRAAEIERLEPRPLDDEPLGDEAMVQSDAGNIAGAEPLDTDEMAPDRRSSGKPEATAGDRGSRH